VVGRGGTVATPAGQRGHSAATLALAPAVTVAVTQAVAAARRGRRRLVDLKGIYFLWGSRDLTPGRRDGSTFLEVAAEGSSWRPR
jgi:hypothetical protein